MQKTFKVKSKDNHLVISLDGQQTYVRIFSEQGTLIRESQAKGATIIHQMVTATETYLVETDGTITNLASTSIKSESDSGLPT